MIERNVIVYGQWTFRDEDIHSGNIYLATSLMSDTLEANTFSATVECADREIIEFERNAPLTYYHRGVQRGIYYVQSVTRVGPTTYTISATSAIGLLIEGLHYGGIYTGQTVAEVLPSICGTVPYVVKTNLRDIALYGWLPIASPRDNLAQVLFAVGAVIKTDLDGVLHIEGLWDGISGTLGRDRMYMGPSVDYEANVTKVVVTEHQYVEGGEETDLFEGTAQDGDLITFDEPMYDLQATGITILESNANYARVSAGSGTLKGRAYIHNTRQITQDVLQANEPNVKTVTEATLVSLVNSLAVAQRVANYYKSVQTINAPAVYRGELPGDLLSAWHPYDLEAVSACLESADINLSNTVQATESLLVGFSPLGTENTEYFENRVVLTGEGDWVVPSGAQNVIAVLIDAGQDGEAGEDGTIGVQPWGDGRTENNSQVVPENQTVSVSSSGNTSAGTAGVGGAAGKGGLGGRILQVTVDVSSISTIHYKCGSVADGAETTFGNNTSANGSRSASGYIDPITGDIFAKPGNDGIPGGNGGGPGQNGDDAGSAKGGAPASGGSVSRSDSWDSFATVLFFYKTTANFQIGDGGGGGAGGDGDAGGAAYLPATPYCERTRAQGYVIIGGSGGNGKDGNDGLNYGCGGDGGSGGGGAGAGGSGSCNATNEAYWTTAGAHEGEQHRVGAAVTALISRADDVTPGKGGKAGKGKDGCVIVYYSLPVVSESGPIVTSQNKYFLDKYGRKVVV